MTRRPSLLLAAFGLALAVGCNSSSNAPQNTSAHEPPPIPLPSGISVPDAPSTIKIDAAKPDSIDAAIQKQHGKIVVVDIWATWCAPCKKEFPHLVELHKKHAKDGVACMSVAWDDLDDKAKALQFLSDKGATFPNFLLDKGDDKPTKKWLDKYDVGAIPVVLVFARDGKLAKKFSGEPPNPPFSYDDVNKLVEGLLKK